MMNKQYIKNICIMYNDVYDMCTTESGAVPDEGAAPRTRKKKLLRASKTSLCKTIEMGNSIAQVNCEPGSNSVTANGWLLQIHADSPPMAGFCMAFADTMHWEMVKPKNRANASSLFMRSS